MHEFKPFPKIHRLNREIVISEKLDGSNAAIAIVPRKPHYLVSFETEGEHNRGQVTRATVERLVSRTETSSNWESVAEFTTIEEAWNKKHELMEQTLAEVDVYAQSRTRVLTPGKSTDNFGFAAWVKEHEEVLKKLGPGVHFGEWYGRGIQRGYGLSERRFALFNVLRWTEDEKATLDEIKALVPQINTVPLIYRGDWEWGVNGFAPPEVVVNMRLHGSYAVPGWMTPEGIVVHHVKSQASFKVTLENDEQHKGEVQ